MGPSKASLLFSYHVFRPISPPPRGIESAEPLTPGLFQTTSYDDGSVANTDVQQRARADKTPPKNLMMTTLSLQMASKLPTPIRPHETPMAGYYIVLYSYNVTTLNLEHPTERYPSLPREAIITWELRWIQPEDSKG